jgi:outer membrane protein, heavy metal efflux system
MFSVRTSTWTTRLSALPFLLTLSLSPLARGEEVTSALEPARLSLEQVLAYAREHAPGREVLDKELGHVHARRQGADVLLSDNPELALAVGPRFGGGVGTDFDFSVGIEQRVGVSGERGRRKALVLEFERRLQAERAVYFWDLRQDVQLAYRSSVHKESLLAIEERAAGFAAELVHVTERRVAAGEATTIDLHVVKADALHAEQGRLAAENAARDARLELAALAGFPLETPPWPERGFLTPAPIPPVVELLRTAESQHPELAHQDALVAEAHAGVAVVDRQARVKPALGATLSREGSAGSPANYILLGTLGVPLPAFQRGQGARAEQRVSEEVARAERERKRRILRAQVVRAHAELSSAEQQLALFRQGMLPELELGLELIERAFRAGELDVLRVALLRDRLLLAERDVVLAHAEYERRLILLEAAVGSLEPVPADVKTAGGAQ